MEGEILDTVTEWGTRSVADGVSGLYELADGKFSGAVTDGTAWAFVLNGRFVGVFDGDIQEFEGASLTAYTAPDVSLPLLYAMQARGGEVRGQYYSNDTPLSELDATLSSGSFVGYVELSENVLSGDYYVVYYGGRSLPVAFVGNNRRLLSGDEAFERAADEVGIYSVVDADVEVVELPERPAGSVAPAPNPEQESESAPEPEPESKPEPDREPTPGDATADIDDGGESATDVATDVTEAGASDADDFSSLGELSGVEDDTATVDGSERGAVEADGTARPDAAADTDADTKADADTEADAGLDVEMDADAGVVADAGVAEDADVESATAGASPGEASPDELARLRRELDAVRETKAELEDERDRIAAERDDLQAEVERLRDRVASLESEVERLEADAAPSSPERTLTPDEALSGTNLFVRYEDKTDGTLDRAAEGRISEEELRDNLRLDYHTEFEAEGVAVDGRSFDAFLRSTPEHQFTEWLLTALVYEIRRTDVRPKLSKLYEAISSVARIDFDGEVEIEVERPDGEREATLETFDVVFRNKMGDPLFVATFEDSRDPTHAGPVQSLVDGARSVSESTESLAAAFAVTTSFFDGDAMEFAVDATRGGLFSRSSRKSYVKLSRKAGFHLCLVEARDGDFFVTVPDL